MKAKNVYVLWSGGLDSTYLIQHLLNESPATSVYAGYVELINNDNKTKMEKAAIQKMLPVLSTLYGKRFTYRNTVLKTEICNIGSLSNFHQMPIWINAIISTTENLMDEIAIGYVMGDDAISYLPELKKVIEAYKPICKDKFPKITFPLSKMKKEFFCYDSMLPELREAAVWCEYPNKEGEDYKFCGRCIPCSHNPIVKNTKQSVKENIYSPHMNFVEEFNRADETQKRQLIKVAMELRETLNKSVQIEMFPPSGEPYCPDDYPHLNKVVQAT